MLLGGFVLASCDGVFALAVLGNEMRWAWKRILGCCQRRGRVVFDEDVYVNKYEEEASAVVDCPREMSCGVEKGK